MGTPTERRVRAPTEYSLDVSCFPWRAAAPSTATVVLGSQWGDEGKGKLVDILAQESDVCCRCAGGNNAGHTIVVKDASGQKITYDFHLLPSGLYFFPFAMVPSH